MNSRRCMSCLRDEANSLAHYRATSVQRTKIRLLMSVQGHSRHSRHPGVSGSPQERTFGQWPVASIRTAIATPVPMGSPGWRDVGRRARFKFFLGGNFADGRVAISPPRSQSVRDGRWSMVGGCAEVAVDVAIAHRGPRDVARWSMVASVEVVGAARARCSRAFRRTEGRPSSARRTRRRKFT
jgi:hypothetical protein